MRKKKSLSRRGRIGRNLLITLLAGILIWLLQGALRRIERESFFTPHSQFQGVLETAWWGPWGLGLNDRWLVFGDLGGGNQFYLWPRTGPEDPAVAGPVRRTRRWLPSPCSLWRTVRWPLPQRARRREQPPPS